MTIIIIIIIIIIINCASVGKQINFDSIKMNSMYVKKKCHILVLLYHN